MSSVFKLFFGILLHLLLINIPFVLDFKDTFLIAQHPNDHLLEYSDLR